MGEIRLAGDCVKVTTGDMQTAFAVGNYTSAAAQIAILHNLIVELRQENERLRKSVRNVRALLELQEFNCTHQTCDCKCCLAIRKAVGDES